MIFLEKVTTPKRGLLLLRNIDQNCLLGFMPTQPLYVTQSMPLEQLVVTYKSQFAGLRLKICLNCRNVFCHFNSHDNKFDFSVRGSGREV